jgi:hypothetical protein
VTYFAVRPETHGMPAYGTKPRCAAVQQEVGYWKCCGPPAPLGLTAALDSKPGPTEIPQRSSLLP